MPESVIQLNEVSINAVRYKLDGQVQRGPSSVYPPKLVTGDYTKDSSPILSTLALSDHRGGIGLDVMEGQGDTDRSWISNAQLRYQRRLILGPLVTATGTLPAGNSDFGPLVEFGGEIYAYITATSSGIYKYDDAGATWGARLLAVTSATDAVSGTIAGTYYVVFADGSNYFYSSDGAAWTTNTQNATYLAIWDEKLWGIDAANGQLWYVTTPGGAVVNDAKLLLGRAAELQGLIVGPDASGEPIIYAVTSHGLYAHDFDNGRFVKTSMSVPNKTSSAYTSRARAAVWRNRIYFSSESTVFEYDPIRGSIRAMGPDKDGGVPQARGSIMERLAPSLNELIASSHSGGSPVRGQIYAWNERGWQVLYDEAAAQDSEWLLASGAYGAHRLWFTIDAGASTGIYWMPLPTNFLQPLEDTAFTYAAAATHDWPWFTAGQDDVTKVAVRLKVQTLNPTTSETVIISYATNWVETYTAFATITAAGITTFNFPNATTPTGTAFRSIRFRCALARGGTNTNTPQLISLTMEYYKKLDPKYSFQVALDLNQEYGGKTVKEQRASLLTAKESGPLVEFTYRDSDANTDATFYVQVRPISGQEQTGHDERGMESLLLVEV